MRPFLNYVTARLEEYADNVKRYVEHKVSIKYLAEGIRAVSENTTRQFGGVKLQYSLEDILTGRTPQEETRSKEEIVGHIRNKILRLKEGGANGRI